MAKITLRGNPINTIGSLPEAGSKAPDFELVANNMATVKLGDFKGTRLVLNISPSIDTGTCAASVRRFNKEATTLANTKVLYISRDLPFAQARFCGAEGIDNVQTLSDFKSGKFGKDYKLTMTEGGLESLHSRCVIVIDEKGVVAYTQQVPEIVNEPDYDDVLKFLRK